MTEYEVKRAVREASGEHRWGPVALADAIGRPIATPTDAREICGINRLQRDPALHFSSTMHGPGSLG
jgi:hypothetical protein